MQIKSMKAARYKYDRNYSIKYNNFNCGYYDISELNIDLKKYRVRCSCGKLHLLNNKRTKTICNKCGKMVYKDKKDEFKTKLLSAIRRRNVDG